MLRFDFIMYLNLILGMLLLSSFVALCLYTIVYFRKQVDLISKNINKTIESAMKDIANIILERFVKLQFEVVSNQKGVGYDKDRNSKKGNI